MKPKLLLLMAAGLLTALPALALDRNLDGIDDALTEGVPGPAMRDGEIIAIVNTGDAVVTQLFNRLVGIGYSPALIPIGSGFEVLSGYDVVCLPVGHAAATHNATFAALATDYHQYVMVGGGLWIGQPNPYQMPDNTSAIPWAPYDLTVQFSYDGTDCPATIVADHCVTAGLVDDDMPFPGDDAISYGSEWDVLVTGGVTGKPAVMFAAYGSGKVLVEFGHPSTGAICPPTDACLENFIECVATGPVATESASWSDVKTLFR